MTLGSQPLAPLLFPLLFQWLGVSPRIQDEGSGRALLTNCISGSPRGSLGLYWSGTRAFQHLPAGEVVQGWADSAVKEKEGRGGVGHGKG